MRGICPSGRSRRLHLKEGQLQRRNLYTSWLEMGHGAGAKDKSTPGPGYETAKGFWKRLTGSSAALCQGGNPAFNFPIKIHGGLVRLSGQADDFFRVPLMILGADNPGSLDERMERLEQTLP